MFLEKFSTQKSKLHSEKELYRRMIPTIVCQKISSKALLSHEILHFYSQKCLKNAKFNHFCGKIGSRNWYKISHMSLLGRQKSFGGVRRALNLIFGT